MMKTTITRIGVCGLLSVLKDFNERKICDAGMDARVDAEEIKILIVLLENIGQNEVMVTKDEAKDFYLTCLNIIERLIKFNLVDGLNVAVEAFRKAWMSENVIISSVKVFNHNEVERIFFLAILESSLDRAITEEYDALLTVQKTLNYKCLKVGWL